jgi:flagellar hook-length control protein FliK
MIIENANLSSLASSSAAVEGVVPPLLDGAGISEGFADALVVQIELLNAVKTEDSASVQALEPSGLQDVSALQGVVGLPVSEADAQDFAALLGNDLPPSYKTKDDDDHEAALAAVTDAWKYIGLEASADEKAKVAEQNMKDVLAMATPVPQDENNVIAAPAPDEPIAQSMTEKAVPAEHNIAAAAVEAERLLQDAVVVDAPVQMDLGQGNDKPDKGQAEDDARPVIVENNGITEELLAAAVAVAPAMAIQAEPVKTINNLTSVDAGEEAGPLPYTKPLITGAKPQQLTNVSENKQQSETAFRQPAPDKPGFNLSDLQNSGQTEKAGRIDQQGLSLEGEKTLPRVGSDMVVPNRVVDNKTDVPAMTKPLSHPEWSKDLGERIVWMNGRAIPSAEIRLNPPHMGPISVRVDVADDQATVVFTAQHSAVRETLEASIPKLREMMGSQHLNLVEASVFQGPASDQGRSQTQNFAQTADGRRQVPMAEPGDAADEVEQEVASGRAVASNGLLSLYA